MIEPSEYEEVEVFMGGLVGENPDTGELEYHTVEKNLIGPGVTAIGTVNKTKCGKIYACGVVQQNPARPLCALCFP